MTEDQLQRAAEVVICVARDCAEYANYGTDGSSYRNCIDNPTKDDEDIRKLALIALSHYLKTKRENAVPNDAFEIDESDMKWAEETLRKAKEVIPKAHEPDIADVLIPKPTEPRPRFWWPFKKTKQ